MEIPIRAFQRHVANRLTGTFYAINFSHNATLINVPVKDLIV